MDDLTPLASLNLETGLEAQFSSNSPEQTMEFGYRLGRILNPPLVVLLIGDLGVGKTILVRGVAKGLGVDDQEQISSPSFTLVNNYFGKYPILHVDLYRLDGLEDYNSIGLFDMMSQQTITLIEWGEKVRPWIADGLEVIIHDCGDDKRSISCRWFNRRPSRGGCQQRD